LALKQGQFTGEGRGFLPVLVIGKSVIKQMAGDTHNNSSLALELTEMGLSLFVCDEDVPVECIAHVSLDDPDFSKKLSMFQA